MTSVDQAIEAYHLDPDAQSCESFVCGWLAALSRPQGMVPGVMRCAKCNFQLTCVTLSLSDGNAYAGDNRTELCPNECGPLRPISWEQFAWQMQNSAETMGDRAIAAEKKLDALSQPQGEPVAWRWRDGSLQDKTWHSAMDKKFAEGLRGHNNGSVFEVQDLFIAAFAPVLQGEPVLWQQRWVGSRYDWIDCSEREFENCADPDFEYRKLYIAAPASAQPIPMYKQNSRFAIDGAIGYGMQNTNKPPSDDHWLMKYWVIGRKLGEMAETPHTQVGNSLSVKKT